MFYRKAKSPIVFEEINSKTKGEVCRMLSCTDLLYHDYHIGSKISMKLRPYKGLVVNEVHS